MAEIREIDFAKRRHKGLFEEYQKWEPLFKDVRDYINPWLGYFEGEEPNSGQRRDDKLICTNSVKYNHILAAGMQWGITSPSRSWVEYDLPIPMMAKLPGVAEWLDICAQITLDILNRSNFYSQNHQLYLEMGAFGTGAMLIEEDAENVINCRSFTAGEYAIGTDKKGQPNSFARNIKMTTYQLVEEFGLDNVPVSIKNAYEQQQYDGWHDVKHLICPNRTHDPSKMDNQSMKYADYYWMDGCEEGKFLRKSGYEGFPVAVGRWSVNGADIYGTGPGIWTLGDAKGLQLVQTDIYTATELGVKPPTMASKDVMMSGGVNILPAGVTYYNPTGSGDASIKPVFQVALNIRDARELKNELEESQKQHFGTKIFQFLIDLEHGTRTATEIQQLASEQMTQMGPMLERLQNEYLPDVLDRVWEIGQRLGVYPPPPDIPEMQGMPIKIKYVSVLAQAQRNYMVTPIMSTLEATMKVAVEGGRPEAWDNIDVDESITQMSALYGAPPSILISPEKRDAIRQARAQQAQQQQMAEMAMLATQGAKNLGGAKMDENSMLGKMAGAGQ